MKALSLLPVLMIAVVATGCGKKRGYYMDDGAANAEPVAQADTANVEPAAANGNIEELPRLDDDTAAPVAQSEPTVASPETPVASNYSAPARNTSTGEMNTYSVQKGDTLMKIAFNLYGDLTRWRDIYDLNTDKLSTANALSAGMTLKYERPSAEPVIERNGDAYLIKTGDTLGTIAQDVYANRSKWKKIYENNRTLIQDPNRIYAGFYLYYQITEAEKLEVEQLRGRKGQPQQLGSSDGLDHQMGKDSLQGGALQSLAAPDSGESGVSEERNPSSAK